MLHQVPTESITAAPSSTTQPLVHFPSVSGFLIPRPNFCSNLIIFTHNGYRILSYPICLSSSTYPRNAYLFNFAFVLDEETPFASYTTVTLKLASLLRTLEEQSRFLSNDTSPPNSGKIYALCEVLMEDLNNYSETQIPIDEFNTLNIKLFPTYPPPPPVLPHHVPLSTVKLADLVDDNWDLTMLRILPYIDGINSVKQISLRADADYKLTRKAVQHLLYYGCLQLLDIFQFKAIYAPTAEISHFVDDPEVQAECVRYVAIPTEHETGDTTLTKGISETRVTELYLALRQGLTVKDWYLAHESEMSGIDVRRFITFGVIKGFLYRVHKYALSPSALKSSKAAKKKQGWQAKGKDKSKDSSTPAAGGLSLAQYLDGTHCFDQICTELMISEKELTRKLKDWNDVQVMHR